MQLKKRLENGKRPMKTAAKTGKTLAIPLTKSLKLSGLWPSDLDPNRELLRFVPYTGARPNIIGLLVDPGGEIELRDKKGKLRKRQIGSTP